MVRDSADYKVGWALPVAADSVILSNDVRHYWAWYYILRKPRPAKDI